MRIAPASDLHLEFPLADRFQALAFPDNTDVIVLAGDVEIGMNAASTALHLADQYPLAHIVCVAGNHEFYHRNIDTQIDQYRSVCANSERVHFLENGSVQIGSVTFIGCTLWTDFSLSGETKRAMDLAERGISDFSLIRTRTGEWFTPKDAVERFEQSCKYLQSELSRGEPEKTVVVTHFPPGLNTRNPNFEIDAITAYFQANVDHIIDKHQPALWVYGHNHYSNDLRRGKTRLVSNQLGYPSEEGRIPSYDAKKTITLDSNKE